jgi:poly(ribitol-phosphate) beta-N-acetylglucosaminyltransferase
MSAVSSGVTVRPKVSVVVPVYNPGSLIDDCIRSLLDQSLPSGEYEVIFVDDGSTDATPARLDELAARHDHVRVRHIANSGWPGRPRNVGIEMARGEFVLFVDNDDWIGREALERIHARATRDGADVVLGKVVGHGKPVPPTLFVENRSRVGLEWSPLVWLLTPHRLFRKSLLDEHGLRFPEGPRRLEDHVFVLGALFRTSRVSVLADYPCYHWMLRDRETNASANEFDPALYYRNLQEVLDIVDEHTEPGEFRDRLYARWYRGKVLSRVGGLLFTNREPQARRARFEEIRRLTEQRFPPELDAQLAFSLRLRSRLVRSGTVEQLERLAELETQLEPRVTVLGCRVAGDATELRLEATARDPGGLLAFAATADGAEWRPPALLADGLPDGSLDAAGAFDANDAHLLLRLAEDAEEFLVPTTVRTRLVPDESVPGQVRLALEIEARIAAGSLAAGGRLRPGRYVLRTVMHVAGFRFSAPVTRGARGMLLTLAVDERGRTRPARPSWKQGLAAWAPGLRRLAVRAKQALRRDAG